MVRASPARITFNAGEFSPLAEGRVDLDRYPASMRAMINFVITPQGPALKRSGTQFILPVYDETKKSALIPFIYNEEQTLILEFAEGRIRFLLEAGPQIYTPFSVSNISVANPFTFTATGHDFEIGDSIVMQSFPTTSGMSLRTIKVTNVVGNVITTDAVYAGATGAVSGPTAAKVYAVGTTFLATDVEKIRYLQSVDVLYLFCQGYRPQKLSRYGAYDWRLSTLQLFDGPYLPTNNTSTRITLSHTGNIIPNMTTNTLPSGIASASTEQANGEAYRAFDTNMDTYWRTTAAQAGWIRYQFPVAGDEIPLMAAATNGAVAVSAQTQSVGQEAWRAGDNNTSTHWSSGAAIGSSKWWKIDFGSGVTKNVLSYSVRASTDANWDTDTPKSWRLEGSNNNSTWTTLDTRSSETGWSSGQRRQYTVSTPGVYRYYRITFLTVIGSSTNFVRVGEIELFLQEVPGAIVPKGYTIYLTNDNDSDTFSSLDYAPSTFAFEGSNNGSDWTVLDRQFGYVLYDNKRSVHFPILNEQSFLYVRLNVKELRRNGNLSVRIARLTISAEEVADIQLTASGTAGINGEQGFLATDVGRLIRMKGTDAIWRFLEISEYISPLSVKATLKSEPFVNSDDISEWRLGAWSDTTGWPTCGTFFEDRLFMAGALNQPDLVAGSRTGAYENFQQTAVTGEVLDDSALVFRMNSRKMSRVRWLADDERGLLAGTGTGEWVVKPPDTQGALTARNIKARQSTSRGSADLEPVQVDKQTLFIQSSRRTLREHAYVFEADGFKSPSMSLFASHLGNPRFAEVEYQAEPYSTLWIRRDDGTLVSCTYLREENVVGWARHTLGGNGTVESMAAIPSQTELQDVLYMIVNRTINGQTRRYIERMRKTWDFDNSLDEAHFVDCGLRYQGAAATVIYGLWYLEGQTLHGLANGKEKLSGLTVVNGAVTLPNAATNVVLGLQYEGYGEITRPEAGAATGTAQGKTKRSHKAVMQLWDSKGGQIGRHDKENKEWVWETIPYPERGDVLPDVAELFTDLTDMVTLPPGYDMNGTVAFKHSEPFPFNMVAIYQALDVQDT